MTEARFFQLGRRRLEEVLAVMLGRVRERGQKAVVLCGGPERAEALADFLWTYDDRSFLPHGTVKDGFAAQQPIWLTDSDERPNEADQLFLLDGITSEKLKDYAGVTVIFDGADEARLDWARDYWKKLKSEEFELTYWEEDAEGKWVKRG